MGSKARHSLEDQHELEIQFDELLVDLESMGRLEEAIFAAEYLKESVPRSMKELQRRLNALLRNLGEQLRCVLMGEPAPQLTQIESYNHLSPSEAEAQDANAQEGDTRELGWSGSYVQTVSVPQEMVDKGVLCQGILVRFYSFRDFSKSSKKTCEVFDRWLDLVPDGVVQWGLVGGNSTEEKQYNKRTYGRCCAQIIKRKNGFFSIGGPQKKILFSRLS